jgi:hypothetical protein
MLTNHAATGASGFWRRLPAGVHHGALLAVAVTALVVTTMVGLAAGGWIGRPFPGFFILPNRTIPSIGWEGWSAVRDGTIYQRTVIAIDGRAVAGNGDAYQAVARHAPGDPVGYTLRQGSTTASVVLPSRTFSRADYWVIFGSYLVTGLLYLWLGVLAAWLLPDRDLGRALLLVGGTGGVYALTGAGIYDPAADMHIHACAEAFFPATLVYVALAFGRATRSVTLPLGALAWWLSLVLAIPYELLLGQPGAYSLVHGACETYCGIAGLVLGGTLIVERARAGEHAGPLLRAAVGGALLGIGVPGVIMTLSGLGGGAVPVNLMTATAFLFPLGLAYGLIREHVGMRRTVAAAPA